VIPALSHVDWRLLRTLESLGLRHIAVYGCSDLVMARSRLLTDALATDADHFVFLDADVIPGREDLISLIESPKVSPDNAVVGCYLVRENHLSAQFKSQSVRIMGDVRFVECSVAGMGIGVVHRSSIERLRDTLPTVIDEQPRDGSIDGRGTWTPYFLPVILETEGKYRYLAEDYSFWWRLGIVGVKLWLDTHIAVGHAKQTIFRPIRGSDYTGVSLEPGKAGGNLVAASAQISSPRQKG
jgi:hypothetical protein